MKVLIADDHAIFRDGLVEVLRHMADSIQVVEADSYPAALEAVDRNPDLTLVLVDLSMPGAAPFEGVSALSQKLGSIPLVVISGHDRRDYVTRAIAAGASGYIPKTLDTQVLRGALGLVLSGGVYLPPTILEDVPPATASDMIAEPLVYLTPRQRDVLKLLKKGLSNKAIARELDLAEGTVKLHLAAVLKALNVTNRVQAALAAEQLFGEPTDSKF